MVFLDINKDSNQPVMSASFTDRRNIKTNGSLIQSPTSPVRSSIDEAFNYNNNSSKAAATSNPTYSHSSDHRLYQDDAHLYDCPADYDIKGRSAPAVPAHGMVLSSVMNASVYADDERIYDAPANIMVVPPPIPAHSGLDSTNKSTTDRRSSESGSERRPHHSVDSSTSSELTVVSSVGSFKTAVPELSTSLSSDSKVR